jgi:guanylate kinase
MPLAPLIVLSGPSGVGKTTLVEHLLATSGLKLRRAVTATTREPRPGEVPDRDYHFWTRDQFRQAIERGEMLEWAEVHRDYFYGTPRSEVDPHRAAGTGVILVVDVQGAGQIRLLYPDDHLSIFMVPPRFDDLIVRLRGRGEREESIHRRMETARGELVRQDEFDVCVENADVATTAAELEKVVRAEFTKRGL